MTYSTILFDFDGTLTPSLELWVEAYQYALSRCGFHFTEAEVVQHCFYRSYATVVADLGIPPEQNFAQLMEAGLAQAFAKVRLFPSARKLLDSCKQAGFTVGLVTSSATGLVERALPQLDLVNYFDTVVTGTDVINHKPHPEPVQLALTRLAKSPAETLFVGDTWMDMHAGRAAGTRTALFLPEHYVRYNDVDKLRATQPDFTFSRHDELMHYLLSHMAS